MAAPSHFLPMISRIHSPSSSSLNMAIKLKALIRDFIFSHLCRFANAFTKAKSIVIELLEDKHNLKNIKFFLLKRKLYKNKNNNNNVNFFGSFRLHYNWCSTRSHVVVPVTSRTMHEALNYNNHVHPATWKYSSYVDDHHHEMVLESQLSGYLNWLEEKNKVVDVINAGVADDDESNEIDRLADKFIANCHQQFMLEKQESYRRFQEMMARSM